MRDEARAAVRMLKGRGVDMIKTQSLLPKDAYFAIADEADAIGIPFEGHVPNAITGMEAIAANQRSFEHLLGVRDTAASLIAELAKKHVWQCPTVINSVGTAADFTSDPGVPFWLKKPVDGWRRTATTQAAETDSAARASEERATRRLGLIKKMYDMKIPFLAGTDAPAGYDLVPGASLHRELQLFVRAGLTPLQALQTRRSIRRVFSERPRTGARLRPERRRISWCSAQSARRHREHARCCRGGCRRPILLAARARSSASSNHGPRRQVKGERLLPFGRADDGTMTRR